MAPELEELAQRMSRDIAVAVTAAVNAHVTEVVTAAEHRLTEQAQINVEAFKHEARLAAEGHAAILDGINQRLDNIEAGINARLDDHDKALANHAQRLTALERSR